MMKVVCVMNNVEELPNRAARSRILDSVRIEGEIQDLEIGKCYPVMALERRVDGGVWIYLHTIEEHYFPSPYPVELFNFLDWSIPGGWLLSMDEQEYGASIKRMSFPEWSHNDRFYEFLVDGDQSSLKVYELWREKLS